MNNSAVMVVTSLGKALLEKPQGRITGDARLLMGLIDGKASVAEISGKVPPSVRAKLPEIFARLLNYGVIEEKGGAEFGAVLKKPQPIPETPSRQPVPAGPGTGEESSRLNDAEIENRRRLQLEKELLEVRAKLDATIERQKKVEDNYHKLTRQVSAYTESGGAALEKGTPQPSAETAGANKSQSGSLESISQLNRALIEQREILDNTLKLRAYQAKLNSGRHQKESEVSETRLAHAHPHYKALRGLDFFKGFSNAEVLDFLGLAKWQEMEAGETILSEGDIGISFYIVVSGSVKIFRKGNLLTTLDRGEFFGEFAYLSGEEPVRSAHAVAATACSLLAVDPLDIEFSTVQLRLRVVEALLRGQVRRALQSDQRVDSLSSQLDHSPHEPR